jgi:hypothetical protein
MISPGDERMFTVTSDPQVAVDTILEARRRLGIAVAAP